MFINLRPLVHYPDFRLLYIGQFVSMFGSMLTYVALPYQIYHLTHSSMAVGNVGLIQLIPLLITSLWGGALADKVNRRYLLLSAEFGLFISSLGLLINSIYGNYVWVIYFFAALSSGLNGFHRPTLEAILQHIIKKEDMPAIASLQQFKFAVSMIVGPSLAGFLLVAYSLNAIYLLDAVTFLISFIAIYKIKTNFNIASAGEPVVKAIKEGIKYAFSRQELLGSYAVDFAAMVFGMPLALFPAIALTFHNPSAIGWLYAAPSVGALATVIFSGWTGKIHRHGVGITISAAIWGAAIVAFGFANNLLLALFFLAIAGGADSISGVFRTTMWNQTIPKNYRGRLAGIEMISYMSGPLLGNAEAGFVAAGFGTTVSVVSGGVLCIVSVIILAVCLPRFWKYSANV